jgi:3-hydroxyethyl bacteriochlorophyllide a dehydrogenase
MEATAVVFLEPERLDLVRLDLTAPGEGDVVVDVAWSGISTGTERLLLSGRMPPFPGMGYPLVPGYESVGHVRFAGPRSGRVEGETVFVPGARCYGAVRGLFGGASARVVVPGERVIPVDASLGERGVLLALSATAQHAIAGGLPDLIVGHGVLGRLIARLTVAAGGQPVVWEDAAERRAGAEGYAVTSADADTRTDYRCIIDASGDAGILDAVIARLAVGGEIVLAGFYADPLSFRFPPAFMREARIRIAAQWQPADLATVTGLVAGGRLSLEGLVTHVRAAGDAVAAYRTAFDDPGCLKMVLDWRDAA